MQTMTTRANIFFLGFSKPLFTKFGHVMARTGSFLAGPPMSERARAQYAINEAQVRRDKGMGAAWAQYPVQGGI